MHEPDGFVVKSGGDRSLKRDTHFVQECITSGVRSSLKVRVAFASLLAPPLLDFESQETRYTEFLPSQKTSAAIGTWGGALCAIALASAEPYFLDEESSACALPLPE